MSIFNFMKPKRKEQKLLTVMPKPAVENLQDMIHIGFQNKKPVYIHLPDYSENGLRFVIIGQSGSGKSFLTRVVIEEFITKGRRTVTFDPEGEWYSLKPLAKDKILVIGGDNGISLGVDPDDEEYQFNDEAVQAIADVVVPKIEWLLTDKGRSIVFDLSNFEDEEQQSIYALISGILFRMQKEYKKTVFVMVDEASLFAPQNEAANPKKLESGKKLNTKSVSKRNAKRGRKIGLRQGYALQRPADFNKGVLANCTLRFIGRIEEENDFEAVKHLFQNLELDRFPLIQKLRKEQEDKAAFMAVNKASGRTLKKLNRDDELFTLLKSLTPGQFFMIQKGIIELVQVKSKTKTVHVGSTPEDDY